MVKMSSPKIIETDIVAFCSDLVRCKSVTPNDDGVMDIIAHYLESFGFKTEILTFASGDGTNVVKNLIAKYGKVCNRRGKTLRPLHNEIFLAGTRKNAAQDRGVLAVHEDPSSGSDEVDCGKTPLCGGLTLGFLGHADVVPAGEGWEVDPFAAVQKDGYLVGRGVADMKGGIAAFCCAAAQFAMQCGPDWSDGAIEILITGDEEVGSYEGAQALLDWCKKNDHLPNDCLIGEPSSVNNLGDRIFLGHRGSLNVTATFIGKQGHAAQPQSYVNSLAAVCKYVATMLNYQWKHHDCKFPLTNLEPTMLFTNNYATNVVPDVSSVNLNMRFGADYSLADLKKIFTQEACDGLKLDFFVNGEAYYCDDPCLKSILASAIKTVVGETAQFSAAGGTSDGRFMTQHCNVIEFGLIDATMHQKNEKIRIQDLIDLEKIYLDFIRRYFETVRIL
jgi:succinyl-diaminopimelate desuccinylase